MIGKSLLIGRKSFCWCILLSFILFQDVITEHWKVAKYFDECFALICLAYYVIRVFRSRRIPKDDLRIGAIVITLCALGFISNIVSNVQNGLKYQLFDAFNIFKFILVILGGSMYADTYQTKQKLIQYLAVVVKVTVCISTFFMFINLVADIGMHTDYRFGVRTYQFIFSRVGGLYSAGIIWLIILLMDQFCRRNSNTFFYLLTIINMISTLRSRAIVFALVFVLVYCFFVVRKTTRLHWYHVALVAAVAIMICWDQIEYYFLDDIQSARSVLLKYGIVTAVNYFPLGAGFATYGTAVARDTYSTLYTQYGFSKYWGLDRGQSFLTDNYWPAILGEFGVFGCLLTVVLIVSVAKKLLRQADNEYSKACCIYALATLIVSSGASSSFFACSQLMLFVCLICRMNSSTCNQSKDAVPDIAPADKIATCELCS